PENCPDIIMSPTRFPDQKFVFYLRIEGFANHGSGISLYSCIFYLVNKLSKGFFILPIFPAVACVYISVVLELECPKSSKVLSFF
ncbi:MAG: hypothetical protein AB2421_20715, partial [Thermotaleaceae bacterium]